jgi:hypothetical protein
MGLLARSGTTPGTARLSRPATHSRGRSQEVGLLVLLLTYLFASFVFGAVERLRQAVQRGREMAA